MNASIRSDGIPGGPLPNAPIELVLPPLVTVPATFDLTSIEAAQWRANRRVRGQLGVLFPLMGLLVVFTFLSEPARLGSARFYVEIVSGVLIGGFLLGFGLFMSYRVWRRGPRRITVTDTGLEFGYSPSRIERLSWRNPKLRLDIMDFRASTFPLRQKIPCDVSVGTLGLRKFSIITDATDAITQVAVERADAVYSRKFVVFGHPSYYWTIRGNAASKPKGDWTRVSHS